MGFDSDSKNTRTAPDRRNRWARTQLIPITLGALKDPNMAVNAKVGNTIFVGIIHTRSRDRIHVCFLHRQRRLQQGACEIDSRLGMEGPCRLCRDLNFQHHLKPDQDATYPTLPNVPLMAPT